MKKINRLICFVMVGILVLAGLKPQVSYADESQYTSRDIYEICQDIISWASSDEELLNKDFISGAGASANDWLFIGYCRLLGAEGTEEYVEALQKYVEDMYASGNLENTKATEWHRVGLALLSASVDPTDFGVDADGNGIDLVSDGTYNHAQYSSLGRQGVNGWCFALIFMDASAAEVPEDADYTREYIINQILSAQLENGGFSLTSAADPDVTSIAIQALSSYYNEESVYTFESDGETVSTTVRETVDAALAWLSAAQSSDGDFSSYGTANAESTAQVLIALTCLGIDPFEDERFIKDGNTVVDGLLRYRTETGGFAHALDEDGAAASETGISSAQSLCALVALYRQMSGMSNFYDFSEDAVAQEVEEETVENTGTEAEKETEIEAEDTKKPSGDISESQETLSSTSDEESELSKKFAYIIAGIAIALGVILFVVMKKIGQDDDKTTSE